MGSQPLLFQHSLDWRFLLPLADPAEVRVLVEADSGLSQALQQVEIQPSQQLAFSEFEPTKYSELQAVVLPFGLPVRWVAAEHEKQVKFLASVRGVLSSGGCLLIGFNNARSLQARSSSTYYSSTPQRISAQLKQSGFLSFKIFGAMPDLKIPEYIFDLDARTIQFALQNRFRRKPILLRALQLLSATLGVASLTNYLPSYFVVATA